MQISMKSTIVIGKKYTLITNTSTRTQIPFQIICAPNRNEQNFDWHVSVSTEYSSEADTTLHFSTEYPSSVSCTGTIFHSLSQCILSVKRISKLSFQQNEINNKVFLPNQIYRAKWQKLQNKFFIFFFYWINNNIKSHRDHFNRLCVATALN